MRTRNGALANAVHGLADFIATSITRTQATHAVCCWDTDWRPSWRVQLIPTYKTHRLADPSVAQNHPQDVDLTKITLQPVSSLCDDSQEVPDDLASQEPLIIKMLQAAGIAIIGADHYEADDVIATLAARSPMPVSIVTGDRDLFQLVDDQREIQVIYTVKGIAKAESFTAADVMKKFGVQPEQYADFALLRGDSSDGLPGVAGIGEKTAAQLLNGYGSISAILAAANDPTSMLKPAVRAKLVAAGDYIAAASHVVTVVRTIGFDGDFDRFALQPILDEAAWQATADELGLRGPAHRLHAALAKVGSV